MKKTLKTIGFSSGLGGIGILSSVIMFGLIFSGCDEDKRYPGVDGRYPVKNETISDNSSDFVLIKKQTFYDESAYGNVRGVYILKDRATGKEYIGVSGIGISERGSHSAGKTTVSDER